MGHVYKCNMYVCLYIYTYILKVFICAIFFLTFKMARAEIYGCHQKLLRIRRNLKQAAKQRTPGFSALPCRTHTYLHGFAFLQHGCAVIISLQATRDQKQDLLTEQITSAACSPMIYQIILREARSNGNINKKFNLFILRMCPNNKCCFVGLLCTSLSFHPSK